MIINKEERVRLAREYFKQGYACSQAVVLAFQDIIGVDAEALSRLSAGLGAGVGRMREVCGAVSGMAMVAGSVVQANPELAETAGLAAHKRDTYALVQDLASKFREQNGSIICRELLGLRAEAKHGADNNPIPEPRTPEYYKSRPCEEMVACAAGLLADHLSSR